MTQENKDLLLKDLCARLPYGVIVQYKGHNTIIKNKLLTGSDLDCNMDYYKPYLRSMFSMTEEEKVQLSQYACIGEDVNGEFIDEVQRKDCAAYIDWLNKNHFDYRGLIPKGLAIEVTENNNPYKD